MEIPSTNEVGPGKEVTELGGNIQETILETNVSIDHGLESLRINNEASVEEELELEGNSTIPSEIGDMTDHPYYDQ